MNKRYVNTDAAKKWFKTPGRQRSRNNRHDKQKMKDAETPNCIKILGADWGKAQHQC